MNYYPFHIGDYAAHTRHLSLLEDLAYRRLLDAYYLREAPFPHDAPTVARLVGMRDHLEEVQQVLAEFFEETDEGWRNSRADAEIAGFQAKTEQAARAGRASAERRSNGRSTDAQRAFNGRSTDVEHPSDGRSTNQNQNQNQNQREEEAIASLPGTAFPPCPHQQIITLYGKHLPHLSQPRTWEGARQMNMRARWVQASRPSTYSPEGYRSTESGLEWWDSFFAYIAKDTKLSQGFEGNGRVWKPDLEWIVKAANFSKIIDGKYDL